MRRRNAGLSLFDLFAFMCVVGGFAIGVQKAMDRGFWQAVLGGLVGAGIGLAGYVGAMLAMLVPMRLWLVYRPFFPRCRNGCCTETDYRYLHLDSAPTGRDKELQEVHAGMLVQCKCGMRYLESSREQCFYEVRDDGTLVPYMHYRAWGRWQPDPRATA